MDSINKQQPENNHKDLSGHEAIEKIKELAEKKTCFFCTSATSGKTQSSRPMSVQQVDAEGNLWFLSANDSHTNQEISHDPSVHLYLQSSAHSGFMSLLGKASISTDKAKIKELWEPICKTWFTEGENDSRISVIRFSPSEGYYWDNKHGNAIAGVKMLIGAMIGKTLDDSVEGRINK